MIERTLILIVSVGVFFILIGIMALKPLIAFTGFFIMLPFILTYLVVFIAPKYIHYIEDYKKSSSINFPNHSAVHNNPRYTRGSDIWGRRKGDSSTKAHTANRTYSGSGTSEATNESTIKTPVSSEIKTAERTLDLTKPYTKAELATAYKEQVKQTHPDTEDGSNEQFIETKESYELLLEKESYSDD